MSYERGGWNSMRADLGVKRSALDSICNGPQNRSLVPRTVLSHSQSQGYVKLERTDMCTCLL